MSAPEDVLAFDVGNTTVTIGHLAGGRLAGLIRVPVAQVADLANRWPPEFPSTGGWGEKTALVGCSVNPAVLRRLEGVLGDQGGRLLLVGRDLDVGMANRTRQPRQVGADRLVNAREAYARVGGAVLVVDLGTAITVDCVSADGAYLGGAIAPGVRLGMAALHEHTALLPAIDLAANPPPLGDDTVSAMQSGVFWGTVGTVRELLRRLLPGFPEGTPVLATGGDAALFARYLPEVSEVAPDLTVAGLYRIYRDAQTR